MKCRKWNLNIHSKANNFILKTNFSSYEIYILHPRGRKVIENNISCKKRLDAFKISEFLCSNNYQDINLNTCTCNQIQSH